MKTLIYFLAKPLAVVCLVLFFSLAASAQPGSGGPMPINEPIAEEPVTGVPIDGGASLLLAAGAAYGLKKVNEFRKGKNQEPQA